MMPTSNHEAQAIVEIIDQYIRPSKARELMARLDEEVGDKTENSSLKISLQMLNGLYASVPPKRSFYKKAALAFVVIAHMLVIIINAAAFFVLPFSAPLWVWMPINSFILTVFFTRQICPLTRLENTIRTSLGMSRIGGFIGHYIVRPTKRLLEPYTKIPANSTECVKNNL